jgi:tetratricopeptide (TPR) repeat protein
MRIRLLLITLLFFTNTFAQSPAEADALFNDRKYEESGRLYAALLEKRPTDALYNYRYARCRYETGDYDSAIRHFLAGGNRYPLRDYYLADSYFQEYRFSEAIEYFNNYTNSTTANQSFLPDVYDKLRRARIGARLINRVEDVEIIDSTVVEKKDFLKYYRLSRETGKFSVQTVNTTEKENIDLVTFITQRGDRKIFSDLSGKRTDLYTANKLLDGWSKPERLSQNVNTVDDENYPFLMLDGITLYFASNNENSIGGYDIFITRFTANTNDYLNPDNIGMPFNSIFNDYMYVIDETLGTGWFVTDRYQPANKVIIYQFRNREEKQYVSGDDISYLTRVARLKTYRKGKHKAKNPVDDLISIPEETATPHAILFMVNDSVSYTNTSQFKSAQALKLWNEWYRISEDLTQKEALLRSLREAFQTSEDEIDKKDLTAEIMELEVQVLKNRQLLNEKIINVRNEEIKYLQNLHLK